MARASLHLAALVSTLFCVSALGLGGCAAATSGPTTFDPMPPPSSTTTSPKPVPVPDAGDAGAPVAAPDAGPAPCVPGSPFCAAPPSPGPDAAPVAVPDAGAPAPDAGPVVVTCVTPSGTYSSKANGTSGYYLEFHAADGSDVWVSCGATTCSAPSAPCPSGSPCFAYPPLETLSGHCQ